MSWIEGLGRPLWQEPEAQRKERSCRLLLSVPFAMVAGGAYGYFLDQATGAGMVPGFLWGSVAFALFFHLQHLLAPVLDGLLVRLAGETVAGFGDFLFDAAAGALVAWLVVDLLGAPVLATVATASALGAVYALALGGLFCGGWLEEILAWAFAFRGASTPPRPDYSCAEAMARRGELGAATDLYRKAMVLRPGDPVPYIRLAKLQAGALRDPREAIRTLEEGRRRARMMPEEELFVARQIVDLWCCGVGEPRRAAPELARMAERFQDSETGRWAAAELRSLKEEMRGEGPSGGERPGLEPPGAEPPGAKPPPGGSSTGTSGP